MTVGPCVGHELLASNVTLCTCTCICAHERILLCILSGLYGGLCQCHGREKLSGFAGCLWMQLGFELLNRRLAGDECFLLVLFSASIIVCSFPTLNLFLPSDRWLLWAVCAGNGDWEVGEISQQACMGYSLLTLPP